MELIEHQKYHAALDYVGKKLLEWSELKPDNKDIKNLVRCMSIIGLYVNDLQKENRELSYVSEKNIEKFIELKFLLIKIYIFILWTTKEFMKMCLVINNIVQNHIFNIIGL